VIEKLLEPLKKLEETQGESIDSVKAKEMAEIDNEIKEEMETAEKLSEASEIDTLKITLDHIEELKQRKKTLQAPPTMANDGTPQQHHSQQQKLRVCDVCASYLSIVDNDKRLADHFGGKLHMGYLTVREKLIEIQENRKKKGDFRESFQIDKEYGYNPNQTGHSMHRRDSEKYENSYDKTRDKKRQRDYDEKDYKDERHDKRYRSSPKENDYDRGRDKDRRGDHYSDRKYVH